MAPFRRLLLIGLATALLSLCLLGLFFFDIDLPVELRKFKLSTLRKFGSTSGSSPELDGVAPPASPHNGVDKLPHSPVPTADGEVDDLLLDTTYPFDQADIAWSSVPLTDKLETTVPNGAIIHGYSVLDSLIMHNGTFYIVTGNRSAFLEKENMVWTPFVPGQVEKDPVAEDIQFIGPESLSAILGAMAIRVPGFSWIIYDVPQFMHHYYHWWGEIILGGWRVYSRVGLDEHGEFHPGKLRMPDRFLLPIVTEGKWRDRAQIIGPLMRAAFPGAAIEERDQWLDLIRLNSTILFDRAMIVNRPAAHRHRWGGRWGKMIGSTQELIVPDNFWSPIRKTLTRNLLGYLPKVAYESNKAVFDSPEIISTKPVVTYISRQNTGRRLTKESHDGLVEALRELEKEGVCEMQFPIMERLGLKEQVGIAARSTILVGVHGNGLTHQLWMPPSRKSAVFEIIYPGSYVFDYEILARNMGHKHYMAWNDTFLTYPKGVYHEKVKFGDNFHSAKIFVDGSALAQKIKEHLSDISV